MRLETLDVRRLMAADVPFGAAVQDTAEYLLGRVAVTPIFLESNGQGDTETQNWSEEEIDAVLATLTDGIHWWSRALDKLDTVHSLDFVIDDRFARDPFETAFEPIDRTSDDVLLPVSEFLVAQGVVDDSEMSVGDAMFAFNHRQRIELETDWSFSIVVVDSSDDPNGSFAPGGFPRAFAYPGGLFMVVPSTRPAQVFAHELGHIFWAVDEYAGGFSHNDSRGYYNTQAENSLSGAPAGFVQQPSIMTNNALLNEAYAQETSPTSTFAMVGWQDSDGDGIFDVLDVPLEFDGTASFDPATRVARLLGAARVIPLPNDNPDGFGHDITLARVGQLQYSVTRDGQAEPWVTLDEPDATSATWDVSVLIEDTFETIRWRVVESRTGESTYLTMGSETIPAASKSSLAGFTFYDTDADFQRHAEEPVLASTAVTLVDLDGSNVFGGHFPSNEFDEGLLANSDTPGFRFESEFYLGDIRIDQDRVGLTTSSIDESLVFGYRESGSNSFSPAWGENDRLRIESDEAVGRFEILGRSRRTDARIRLEAFDEEGNRVARVSTEALERDADFAISIDDPKGRIRSVQVWALNGARFEISDVHAGPITTVMADQRGVWDVRGLVPGQYRLRAQAVNMIYQEPESVREAGGFLIDVTAEQVVSQPVGLVRVDSSRHNVEEPDDVDDNGNVSPVDALIVINEIRRRGGSGVLDPTVEPHFVDVNNDGEISPIDALMVINSIRKRNGNGEGEASSPEASSLAASSQFNDLVQAVGEITIQQISRPAIPHSPDEFESVDRDHVGRSRGAGSRPESMPPNSGRDVQGVTDQAISDLGVNSGFQSSEDSEGQRLSEFGTSPWRISDSSMNVWDPENKSSK